MATVSVGPVVNAFALQGSLAGRAPWYAIGAILLTGVFSIGFFLDEGPTHNQPAAFLPENSPQAPMQQFGGLTALTTVYSLVAAFVVLPPMLVLWAVYHEWHGRQSIQWRSAPKGIVSTGSDDAIRVVAESDGRAFVPDAVAQMECPQCRKKEHNPRCGQPI